MPADRSRIMTARWFGKGVRTGKETLKLVFMTSCKEAWFSAEKYFSAPSPPTHKEEDTDPGQYVGLRTPQPEECKAEEEENYDSLSEHAKEGVSIAGLSGMRSARTSCHSINQVRSHHLRRITADQRRNLARPRRRPRLVGVEQGVVFCHLLLT